MIGRFLAGIIRGGTAALDGYELAPFEAALLEEIVARTAPNIAFISSRWQFAEMLRIRKVGRGSPEPWVSRSSQPGRFEVRFRLAVGARHCQKPFARDEWRCDVRCGTSGLHGDLHVVIPDAVHMMVVTLPHWDSRQYPEFSEVSVGDINVVDERPYWRSQARSHPSWRAFSHRIQSELETGLCGDDVVLPAPSMIDRFRREGELRIPNLFGRQSTTIAIESLPPTFESLLAFSNGIVVNDLQIYGLGEPNMVVQDDYVSVGAYGDSSLYCRLSDGRMSEELFQDSADGHVPYESTGRDMVEWCKSALTG